MRKFEYANARSDFEAALVTDGSFLDARRRLVEMWETEGNRKKALEGAERVRSMSAALTPRQRAEAEANVLSLGTESAKGTEAQRALFDATPDDVELGLRLIEEQPAPKTASAIV